MIPSQQPLLGSLPLYHSLTGRALRHLAWDSKPEYLTPLVLSHHRIISLRLPASLQDFLFV
jgi:hypothetical protein